MPRSFGSHRRHSPIGTHRRPTRRSVTYSRWDVVAVVFPFLEGDQAKHRPALIVSTERLHEKHELYWAVMITTAKAGVREEDIPIPNPEPAGLPDSCVIRVSRLTTLSD